MWILVSYQIELIVGLKISLNYCKSCSLVYVYVYVDFPSIIIARISLPVKAIPPQNLPKFEFLAYTADTREYSRVA